MKHTPTPWEICNNYIKKVGGAVIATTARNNAMCRYEAEPGSLADAANAAFIVRTVNNHEQLIDAIKLLLNAYEGLIEDTHPELKNYKQEFPTIKKAKAAIEAAGGEG